MRREAAALSIAIVAHGLLLGWLIRKDTPRPAAALPLLEVQILPAPRTSAASADTVPSTDTPPNRESNPPSPARKKRREASAPSPLSISPETRPTPPENAEPYSESTPEAATPARPAAPSPATPEATPSSRQAPAGPVAPLSTAAYIPAEYAARNRKPVYPALSRRYGEEGTVVLRVLVKADGSAGEITIQSSSGHPLLDQAAQAAVKDWRFQPATRDGQTVADWYLIPIPFTLHD